jgi:hypothetical protein
MEERRLSLRWDEASCVSRNGEGLGGDILYVCSVSLPSIVVSADAEDVESCGARGSRCAWRLFISPSSIVPSTGPLPLAKRGKIEKSFYSCSSLSSHETGRDKGYGYAGQLLCMSELTMRLVHTALRQLAVSEG